MRSRGGHDGRLAKWLDGADVNASLLSVAALYDVLPLTDPSVVGTVAAVEQRLTNGGVHRYRADTFYGGGQWPMLTSLLAWHHARADDLPRAAELLDRVVAVADADLLLSEQVAPLPVPDVLDEWLARWGPSATRCCGRTACPRRAHDVLRGRPVSQAGMWPNAPRWKSS